MINTIIAFQLFGLGTGFMMLAMARETIISLPKWLRIICIVLAISPLSPIIFVLAFIISIMICLVIEIKNIITS